MIKYVTNPHCLNKQNDHLATLKSSYITNNGMAFTAPNISATKQRNLTKNRSRKTRLYTGPCPYSEAAISAEHLGLAVHS